MAIEDPVLTLKDALYDNWALTGNLSKYNINFNTWVLAKDRYRDSAGKSYTRAVIVSRGPQDEDYIGIKYVKNIRAVYITCYVLPLHYSSSSLGTAKAELDDMVQEIQRILHAANTSLDDISLWLPGGSEPHLPEEGARPELAETVTAFCLWVKA